MYSQLTAQYNLNSMLLVKRQAFPLDSLLSKCTSFKKSILYFSSFHIIIILYISSSSDDENNLDNDVIAALEVVLPSNADTSVSFHTFTEAVRVHLRRKTLAALKGMCLDDFRVFLFLFFVLFCFHLDGVLFIIEQRTLFIFVCFYFYFIVIKKIESFLN